MVLFKRRLKSPTLQTPSEKYHPGIVSKARIQGYFSSPSEKYHPGIVSKARTQGSNEGSTFQTLFEKPYFDLIMGSYHGLVAWIRIMDSYHGFVLTLLGALLG